jgi:glutathione S-transferase
MTPPVLWHIPFSNYNEKARWALDYKRVAHLRREAPNGLHPVWARALGGGRTFPLLILDGRPIGDSTAIVAALEAAWPDPPLYPADPAERARALALEDWFDREVGDDVRRVGMDAVRRDPDHMVAVAYPDAGPRQAAVLKAGFPVVGRLVRRYYRADPSTIERAWARLATAAGRFKTELQPSGYLVGDRFSVADLTFAALVGAALQPEGYPYPAADPRYRGLPELRDRLAGHGVLEWIEEMYARHRGTWRLP